METPVREKGKKHNKMRKLRERERERGRGRTKKEAGGMIKKKSSEGRSRAWREMRVMQEGVWVGRWGYLCLTSPEFLRAQPRQ